MRKSKCKDCGADIVWIPICGGKSIACDAQEVVYKERKNARGTIITPNGEMRRGLQTDDITSATGLGYVPHEKTCPKAHDSKRKGAAR